MLRRALYTKITLLILLILILASCSENPINYDKNNLSSIEMQISVTDNEQRVDGSITINKIAVITKVTVTVSGSDMSTITEDLTESGQGRFTGTIDIPKGDERTFLVEAKDAVNIVQYEGSTSKNIQSDNESVTINLTPIYPFPVNLTLINFDAESVTLSWTRSNDADFSFYRLVRSTTTNFDLNNDPSVDIDNINTLSFTNTELMPNTPYYYKVYVVDTELLAMGSNTISFTTAAQEAPTGVSASVNSPDDVFISWNFVTGATSYNIYRDTVETGTFPLTYSTTNTSFVDDDVDQARFYYYRISAIFGSGNESSISDYVFGYRTGWRFSNIAPFGDTDGFGNDFDLRAYGYNGLSRVLGIYAYYDDGTGNYFYVPGSGTFGYAGAIENRTSPFNETIWADDVITLPYSTWDPGYQNNTFQQYVGMEIYKSSSISSFSDDSYDFYVFPITWNSNNENNPQFKILSKLDEIEAKGIKNIIRENPDINYINRSNKSDLKMPESNVQGKDESISKR